MNAGLMRLLAGLCLALCLGCDNDTVLGDPLTEILNVQDTTLTKILDNTDKYEVQILYTQIERTPENNPILTSFSLGLNDQYFYPASTVKMPVAFLALQRINELSQETSPEIDMYSKLTYGAEAPPQTPMTIDSSSPTGFPHVAHFVEQIFSVSDNQAYNRLYEFLGQDYINEELRKKGIFQKSRIRTRVGISGFDTESNKYTNPAQLTTQNGDTLYAQDEYYALYNDFINIPGNHKGIGYYSDDLDSVIHTPFDMSEKNYISLVDLEASLQRVIFPDLFEEEQKFNLSEEQYAFLHRIMPMTPLDFDYHQAHSEEYFDSYVKFFWDGNSKDSIPDNIKIFNKVGWAYGTLTDCSYIIDLENNIEFFLTATILVNDNQIFNDGQYEYESIGLPFLASLGKAVYEYELNRPRNHMPIFSNVLSQ